MDCIFCKIINNEISSYKIYEDDIVLVFLDVFPKSNGHTLIIPKKHYINILDIDINTLQHINFISKKIYLLLKEKLNIDGLTIMNNNEYKQDIKHFHMHLIPTYKNESKLNIEEVYKKIKD